jgi:NAD(P)-dependent dehydrogenase (short-subunit alcohol dehydrogenase family)
MLLQNRTAVIYGAGGSLGTEAAIAFAREGAYVYITGTRQEPLDITFSKVREKGGQGETVLIDALDQSSVNKFIEKVIKEKGRIDISFNLIHLKDLQGIPLIDLSIDDFCRPIKRAMESHFITGTAAGRAMKKQGSGVILSLTATPGGIGYPLVGGFGPACRLIESISLSLATELGPFGIRVINIRSGGSPDSKVFKDAVKFEGKKAETFIRKMEDDTMLKKLPRMEDITNAAVFLASPGASGITGVTVDITCGTTAALNYKVPQITFVQTDS